MNTFEYDVYYEWQGRTPSDPFVDEKTPYQIEDALRSFHGELGQSLRDLDASTSTSPVVEGTTQVRLTVTTVLPRFEVDKALNVTLTAWRLFANPIET